MAVQGNEPISADNLKDAINGFKQWYESITNTYISVTDNVVSGSSGITMNKVSEYKIEFTFQYTGTYQYDLTATGIISGSSKYDYLYVTLPNGKRLFNGQVSEMNPSRSFKGRLEAQAGQKLTVSMENMDMKLNVSTELTRIS